MAKAKKKTIMESLVIEELSGVDRPAQEGAKALIIKRDDSEDEVADLKNALKAFDPAKDKECILEFLRKNKEYIVELTKVDGEKQMAKEVEMVEKSQLDQKESELAVAKAFGALNDAEKSYYYALDADKQGAFMKLDADGRKNELDAAKSDNPVVYKDHSGSEYFKNDDPRIVENAKRADRAEKLAKSAEEKVQDQELEKRAGDGLNFLPGDVDVKKNLLKAVDSIADSTVREGVEALLKAGNDSMSKAFEKIGTKAGDVEKKKDVDEYEKLAEEYAKSNSCSIEVARAEVLEKTEAGRELYKKMEAARQA